MKISIGYITAREAPHLEWLINGIENQAKRDDEIELIVVDALGRPVEAIGYRPIRAIKRVVATRPKPTPWQGPHRLTAHDFFANANARNTALVLCRTDYIVFLDDRCKPDPSWLEQIRIGEKKRKSVICGPYDKYEDRGVSIDHRKQREPQGKKNCGGGWCFGGNFALPLEWALEVNGCEEGCDPVGLEDCVLGHMLENTGRRIDFVIEMSVQQDRRGYVHPLNFPRQDKGTSPADKSHGIRARFHDRKRTELTPDLKKLRETIAKGGAFPLPDPAQRDWYDGRPIAGTGMGERDRLTAASGAVVHDPTPPPTAVAVEVAPIVAPAPAPAPAPSAAPAPTMRRDVGVPTKAEASTVRSAAIHTGDADRRASQVKDK